MVKADLVELTDDDRATLLGALLDVAGQFRNGADDGTPPADLVTRWRRAGLRAFAAERDATAAGQKGHEEGQTPGLNVAPSYPGSPTP